MMRILTEIPLEHDVEALMKSAHVELDSEDAAEFRRLAERAAAIAHPKAVFRECYVEARGENTVTIDGVTFTSRALRKNLDKAERVFAYVATCGQELDQLDIDTGDFLGTFWLDIMKADALRASVQYLNDHLDRTYALSRTSSMSPGSGDVSIWPIEQQKELFYLIGDVKGAIGVELTPSFLMVPNKTVSGIRFPTEIDFRTCQLCHRCNCPSRAAPFDKALWESMGHE